MKLDIVKGQETLENHKKYAAFLEIMMPDGVEDASQFFDVPQNMIDCLENLRRIMTQRIPRTWRITGFLGD
jgi:hypothetical protein